MQNNQNNEQLQSQHANGHGCKVKRSYSQTSVLKEELSENRRLASMDDYIRGGGCIGSI